MENEKRNGKTSVILRIVIWSVVLVLLLGIFISLMVGGNVFGIRFSGLRLSGCGTDYYYDDTGYEVGNTDITEAIRELSIDWLDGQVSVKSDPSLDALTIRELDRDGSTPDDENALRWKLSGGKLTVRVYKPRKVYAGTKDMNKTLEVCIPEAWLVDLRIVSIDSVSGDIDLVLDTSETLDKLDVDTVSGEIELTCNARDVSLDSTSGSVTLNGDFGDVSVDTVSGKIFLTGAADELELESTSGNMTVTLSRAARELEADTVSGKLTLTLPADIPGFTADMDSVSGDVEINDFATTSKKHTYTYGDGSMQIKMDSTSGDLIIKKGA